MMYTLNIFENFIQILLATVSLEDKIHLFMLINEFNEFKGTDSCNFK